MIKEKTYCKEIKPERENLKAILMAQRLIWQPQIATY